MTTRHVVVGSPVGELTLVATDEALTGVYMTAHRRMPALATLGAPEPTHPCLVQAAEELEEYFAGQRRHFDVAVHLVGSEFQRRVWAALTDIPYGETWTYGELSEHVGAGPRAVRAVGGANGRNPVSIVVPCHRVIGADGTLTGFGGGIERKRYLLDLENPGRVGATLF
ncbi:methylated-DNA--[protein]-cysteine S-methyltransferase [Actinotalea sp. K2]|uniref:methylated-DNA--[protein]-cysteine S-methyltransferase n=1 Tax=Actinotalea sp. K2 TaxID=2939438 RepID=UPI0020170938|nr:methylated-DNA--[protein]-cysteine S-methyltransferase [Actinotalea sp. K2]MCL3862891.1 methylated-DNA--[protein]-cysteine S-methyltransferase [Actinotalea sp. K2]